MLRQYNCQIIHVLIDFIVKIVQIFVLKQYSSLYILLTVKMFFNHLA